MIKVFPGVGVASVGTAMGQQVPVRPTQFVKSPTLKLAFGQAGLFDCALRPDSRAVPVANTTHNTSGAVIFLIDINLSTFNFK
jgi:hypothetical protein